MTPTAAEIAFLYEEARRRRAEGNTTGAFARYRRVLEAAEARGDAAARVEVLAEMGEMYQEVCDLLEARNWLEAAVEGYRALGERGRAAGALRRLGQVAELAGDLEAAAARFAAARAEALAAGDAELAALLAADEGSVAWHRRCEAEGAAALLAAWRALRGTASEGAVLASFRAHRARLGRARFRMVLRAAGATAAEAAELEGPD